MFRTPTPQNTRRAQAQTGVMTPLALPSKGMNVRDTLQSMGPQYAISIVNAVVDPYGVRTRKGYSEWAINLPGAPVPVRTLMSYYPSTAAPTPPGVAPMFYSGMESLLHEPVAPRTPPAGNLFASKNGLIYDVTAGGSGPWTPEADVSGGSDFWTWINFTNTAGSFLIITNDNGGYAYYDGTTWTTPTMGGGAGQIDNVDPLQFAFVVEFKKRLWFVEKDSTRAWYLPVSQITGAATEFDFGEQFHKGGHLVALANWTVDGGEGIDDYLVAVSSQGNVVVYKGSDPSSATTFALHGVWDVGPLPVGRRAVSNTGSDVMILSHFGMTPLSALLSTTQIGAIEEKRLTFQIAPLIARLMRDYSTQRGWAVNTVPTQELLTISVPFASPEYGGALFALKVSTGAWQLFKDLPYVSICTVDSAVFCGTSDGRVVRGFDGPLDNVNIAGAGGMPIQCQVTPAYQSMGIPGAQKVFKLIRPTFITTVRPTLKMQVMVNFGPPKPVLVPTLPTFEQSLWDESFWNIARWSGLQEPIAEWFGAHGVGFVGTVQLEYACGGDTLLASIDFWTEPGGVM